MRRKSERSSTRKSKPSPEKKIEKVKRTRTRRRKQSTSSDNESAEEAVPVQEEVVVDSEKKPPSTPVKEESPEEAQDQVWRVKAPESADSGEIQKLKICLTRPPSTPERAERSPRSKRKHSRATSSSDAASGDAGDDKKKTRHRSRRAHRDSKDEPDGNQDSHDEEQETENEVRQSNVVQENENEVTQSDKDKPQATESAISTTNEETTNTASGESSRTGDDLSKSATETECKSDADTTVASPKPETTVTSPKQSSPSESNEDSVTDKQDDTVKNNEDSIEGQNDIEKQDNSTEKQHDLSEKQDQLLDKQNNVIEKQDENNQTDQDSSIQDKDNSQNKDHSKAIEKCDNTIENQHDVSTSAQDISMHDRSESHDESEMIELHPDDSKIETSDIEMTKLSEREDTKGDEDQQVKVSKSRETVVSNEEGAEKNETTKDNNESGVVENENDDRELRKPSADSEHDKDTEKSEAHKQPLEIERQSSNDSSKIDATPPVREDISQNGQAAPIVVNRKRRWGTRPTKLTTQKSITISTDVLKEIIPDVKPVEFEEVIEEKKHRRVEVTEKIERPVLPKIVIDNTSASTLSNVDQNKKEIEAEERDKDSLKSREPTHLASNRKISIIKDNDSILARPPSPPKHKQSSILYITNLVRPFTLPQLKNLLQRTGRIAENGFWIDRIKSRCFVQYETEDQAVETRHALHGVKWPVSNPKTLQVDFSTQDAFDKAKTNEDTENAPISTIPGTVEDWLREQDQKRERGEVVNDKPWERKAAMREWDVGKNDKDKEREKIRREERLPDKRRHRSQERSPEPARKFKKKEEEAPAKLLDDLFRKTKTTPCIYWLPLSAETIAVKEEQRRQHMAEYERRLQEQRRPHRRH